MCIDGLFADSNTILNIVSYFALTPYDEFLSKITLSPYALNWQ